MAALFRFLCNLGAVTLATVAQAQGIGRDAAIDTEHIFGFTEGADIGGKGERELENTTMAASGDLAASRFSPMKWRSATVSANIFGPHWGL